MKRRAEANIKEAVATTAVLLLFLVGCGGKGEASRCPKVIVLGFDGMDPRLCERLMDEGRLPNLARMRAIGGYRRLGTTIPPQSPVAWASFITGANPGVHGIFDFIHRDPRRQCEPYYSAAETVGGDEGWEVDGYRLPLRFWPFRQRGIETRLRRGGTPFWDELDRAGVPVYLYEIPANYPPSPSSFGHQHCLAGMGVPDLMGGYGTYQFFSEETVRETSDPGGMRIPLIFEGDGARATLRGPVNPYRVAAGEGAPEEATIDFDIHRHPTQPTARIEIQDHVLLLREGEWSEWVPLTFRLSMPRFLPAAKVHGICRFYLQQVRPDFRLYVSPINIDPSHPGDQKITEPPGWIRELARALGLFATAGFQEDHKALSNGVFTDAEYKRQADDVLRERLRLLDYARAHYRSGLLFFYFSSTDLQAHMFWWTGKEKHPVRDPQAARFYHEKIEALYERMDAVVGDMVRTFGNDAVILVMSDHGFGNFRRQFNLNTWLREEGYLNPPDCRSLLSAPPRVDWSKTRAYGLGLNGLYVNLKGRERDGIVEPSERDALLAEITRKLLAVRDPQNGQPVIARVYRAEEVYHGPMVADAPDLIIGYHRGYRASWATTLGDLSDTVLSDNDSAWSADHCIAAEEVPGVIFSNRPIDRSHPSLIDLAPTILRLFDVKVPARLEGKSLFEQRDAPVAAR
ncbi:MAG: sulfatase arylsulfatase [Planctomycetota bacterium]|nr:MAG: sulfatase arylsulfatase [Planctomycetota bacterium]